MMDAEAVKIIHLRAQTKQTLLNAIMMTDMALDMKSRAQMGENFVSNLRRKTARSRKVVAALRGTGQGFIQLALQTSKSTLHHMETSMKGEPNSSKLMHQYTKLINTLRKQCQEVSDSPTSLDHKISNLDLVKEKIRNLEAKQQLARRGLFQTNPKLPRVERDDKYPKNFSKELLIDLSAVVNLPTVPEDAFTTCAQPVRCASSSSVKSLRKLMMTLQKAESENQETTCNMAACTELSPQNDSGCASDKEVRPSLLPGRTSVILADITEESNQEYDVDNEISTFPQSN